MSDVPVNATALWGLDEWLEPRDGGKDPAWLKDVPGRSWLGKLLRYRLFVVEVQIEPADGDTLDDLGALMSADLGLPMARDAQDGDRAIYIYGTHWGNSHLIVLDNFRRFLGRKIGHLDVGDGGIRVMLADDWANYQPGLNA